MLFKDEYKSIEFFSKLVKFLILSDLKSTAPAPFIEKKSRSFPETLNISFSLMVMCAKGSTKVSAIIPIVSLAVVGPNIGSTK